ncbi:MAG: hypothetical protein WC819_03950 [Parcubacteria group bacterium]|jgi:hypothetical protein
MEKITIVNLILKVVTVYVNGKVVHVIPAATEGSVPADEIRENVYYLVDIRRVAERKDFIFAQQPAGPRRMPRHFHPYFIRFKNMDEFNNMEFLPAS